MVMVEDAEATELGRVANQQEWEKQSTYPQDDLTVLRTRYEA